MFFILHCDSQFLNYNDKLALGHQELPKKLIGYIAVFVDILSIIILILGKKVI